MELKDDIHAKVVELTKRGDLLAEEGRYDRAVTLYRDAWSLLPDPKEDWDAATWLLAAMGDALFLKGDYPDALQVLMHAMSCPKAIGNPFLHLRLGQVQFEVGDKVKALDELTRAYMGAGEEVFQAEDPKYLQWLRANILPPAFH